MWALFYESITDILRLTCTGLAFLIPYIIYKVNRLLHDYGDPPWKKDEQE